MYEYKLIFVTVYDELQISMFIMQKELCYFTEIRIAFKTQKNVCKDGNSRIFEQFSYF